MSPGELRLSFGSPATITASGRGASDDLPLVAEGAVPAWASVGGNKVTIQKEGAYLVTYKMATSWYCADHNFSRVAQTVSAGSDTVNIYAASVATNSVSSTIESTGKKTTMDNPERLQCIVHLVPGDTVLAHVEAGFPADYQTTVTVTDTGFLSIKRL